MKDAITVECLSCSRLASGVRTSLGTVLVPGYDGCPQCGADTLADVSGE